MAVDSLGKRPRGRPTLFSPGLVPRGFRSEMVGGRRRTGCMDSVQEGSMELSRGKARWGARGQVSMLASG